MIFKSEQSIYTQIMDYLKKEIFCGNYCAGQKLPPIRELAAQLAVNPNTIVRAYAELEKEGLLFTESTNGKFVTADIEFIKKIKIEYVTTQAEEFVEITEKCKLGKEEVMQIMEGIYGK